MKKTQLLIICAALASVAACRRDEITVQRVPKETAAPMMGAPAPMAVAAGHSAKWTAPKGWAEQPATAMRVGSYKIGEGADAVDVSVVPLAGEAGGELANINRWRGQLGLPPVDQAGLAGIARRTTVGPHQALLVEFASTDAEPKRLLAAVLTHDGTSWFFKATGPNAAVSRMKPDFLAFVGSVTFEHP